MERELIRTDIMNLTLAQWDKVNEIENIGFIEVSPKELIKLIGFSGGMFFTGKANKREVIFINKFYKHGRAMEKSNIHPLFEQILDVVRPVEAARIKAEKAMRKLKTINIEIKTLKK